MYKRKGTEAATEKQERPNGAKAAETADATAEDADAAAEDADAAEATAAKDADGGNNSRGNSKGC